MWANVSERRGRVDARDGQARGAARPARRRPEEPARAALWLLSDDAAYVTGAQIACDGGVLAKASISV